MAWSYMYVMSYVCLMLMMSHLLLATCECEKCVGVGASIVCDGRVLVAALSTVDGGLTKCGCVNTNTNKRYKYKIQIQIKSSFDFGTFPVSSSSWALRHYYY
jgi:hypothetical protein